VSPVEGSAIFDEFLFEASQWTDDAEDLPLTYDMGYYTDPSKPTEAPPLKTGDPVSYTTTFMAQGLEPTNFEVYCTMTVYDVLRASAGATTTITVLPPTAAIRRRLQITSSCTNCFLTSNYQILLDRMATFLSNQDAAGVSATADISLATLNSANCSYVPQDCASINRAVCSRTGGTCGACLSGYTGIPGDSNIPCGLASSLKAVGDSCGANTDCMTGSCVGSVCADVQKSCPFDCSNANGVCKYFDFWDGAQLDTCSVMDTKCYAECACASGWNGPACTVSDSEQAELISYRESMCANIYAASFFQDLDVAVIRGRVLTIGNILIDPVQVSEDAAYNCTTALLNTVAQQPSLACDSIAFPLLITALSNVLSKGASMPPEFLSNVTAAIDTLMVGCQSNAAIGEAAVTETSTNLRVLTVVVDKDGVTNQVFSLPVSEFEEFTGDSSSNVVLNADFLTSTESLGFSVFQLNGNPFGAAVNSTQLVIQTIVYGGSGSSSAPTSNSTLRNNEDIDYVRVSGENITVVCDEILSVPYNVSGTCADGQTVNVECPAGQKGEYIVTCPGYHTQPECVVLDETTGEYELSAYCSLVDYTSAYTTCTCNFDDASSDRRRLSNGEGSEQISSRSVVVAGDSVAHPFQPEATSSSGGDGGDSALAGWAIALIVIACLLVAGCVVYYCMMGGGGGGGGKRGSRWGGDKSAVVPVDSEAAAAGDVGGVGAGANDEEAPYAPSPAAQPETSAAATTTNPPIIDIYQRSAVEKEGGGGDLEIQQPPLELQLEPSPGLADEASATGAGAGGSAGTAISPEQTLHGAEAAANTTMSPPDCHDNDVQAQAAAAAESELDTAAALAAEVRTKPSPRLIESAAATPTDPAPVTASENIASENIPAAASAASQEEAVEEDVVLDAGAGAGASADHQATAATAAPKFWPAPSVTVAAAALGSPDAATTTTSTTAAVQAEAEAATNAKAEAEALAAARAKAEEEEAAAQAEAQAEAEAAAKAKAEAEALAQAEAQAEAAAKAKAEEEEAAAAAKAAAEAEARKPKPKPGIGLMSWDEAPVRENVQALEAAAEGVEEADPDLGSVEEPIDTPAYPSQIPVHEGAGAGAGAGSIEDDMDVLATMNPNVKKSNA